MKESLSVTTDMGLGNLRQGIIQGSIVFRDFKKFVVEIRKASMLQTLVQLADDFGILRLNHPSKQLFLISCDSMPISQECLEARKNSTHESSLVALLIAGSSQER